MKHYLLNINTFTVNMLLTIVIVVLIAMMQQQQYEYEILQENMSIVWQDSTDLLAKYKALKRKRQ